MGFVGVYKAIYNYAPQADGELAIADGDLLYVLDKSDDGWWKVKKKAGADDEEEPTGLVPNNYVEEAPVLHSARSLYEYTRQTDEELSFPEDAVLSIYDQSDPDWILVGFEGDFGFVPSNYIEPDSPSGDNGAVTVAAPSLPARPPAQEHNATPTEPELEPDASSSADPAVALAGVIQGRAAQLPPLSLPARSARPPSSPEESVVQEEEEATRSPALPSRPRPHHETTPYEEPSAATKTQASRSVSSPRTPGGFRMYHINEMVSVMGKRKKMPTALGINLATGTILISPERVQDGPSIEWSADKMTHYSREEKHVFVELVRPSKSVDFHAGARDTAEEIVAALGELAGAVRAEGLREVIMAGSGSGPLHKKGQVLYDFMAQGEDEVTVAIGDDVLIIDDSKSEEWWQVRRLKNGKEGVVPSSYIEITGTSSPPPRSSGGVTSTVEQNRQEEIRLTKEAIKASKEPHQQRNRKSESSSQSKSSKSKPDSSKVRTWTDRSKSFSVEAQFLGLKDGKIHLHKTNGVKIAVPIAKMSKEDLEYVEDTTGLSLDDDRPLADVKKAQSADREKTSTPKTAVSKSPTSSKPEYDWFQFFLSCDVAVGLCERYAQSFIKDSMDESVLPDVDAGVLRNLGIREGDIIKIMRFLDTKFNRDRNGKRNASSPAGENDGGLFSGPGGTLRNNTRKGRPAPAIQTSDVVDAKAFLVDEVSSSGKQPVSPKPTKSVSSPRQAAGPSQAVASGFEDDAWDVKPNKQNSGPASTVEPKQPQPAAPQVPALTGSLQELSLLSTPLQPTQASPPARPQSGGARDSGQVAPPAATSQPPGANPAFFSNIPQSGSSLSLGTSATARQRPVAPQQSSSQGALMPPPPQRPLSAPQSAQASAFPVPSLMPQMTGGIQSQVAPPGQSLHELGQARMQQQYLAQMQQQQQQQQTGFPAYSVAQAQGLSAMQTGMNQPYMQPMMTGVQGPSPFADSSRINNFPQLQTQPTGLQPSFTGQYSQMAFQQPAPSSGMNSYLPPALEPQRTGVSNIGAMNTGAGTYNNAIPAPQPLQPQQTGPAPAIRFGVTPGAKPLAPQATGRRANLAQATPQNPFGF